VAALSPEAVHHHPHVLFNANLKTLSPPNM
jgi:hypothetical protein